MHGKFSSELLAITSGPFRTGRDGRCTRRDEDSLPAVGMNAVDDFQEFGTSR
jgi:hypothetical protein